MNNKAIIEFGFRSIWRILQIKEGVIHRGRRPRWITPSEICRILHILLGLIPIVAKYIIGDCRKYPYPTTSLQIIFVYKQVNCQAKDKFSPEKKASVVETKFRNSGEEGPYVKFLLWWGYGYFLELHKRFFQKFKPVQNFSPNAKHHWFQSGECFYCFPHYHLGILDPFTPKSDFRDFTLPNARRFHSSKGDPLGSERINSI